MLGESLRFGDLAGARFLLGDCNGAASITHRVVICAPAKPKCRSGVYLVRALVLQICLGGFDEAVF